MQRTPGMYTAINTQTQRTGLPSQNHSIVFITGDVGAPATPTPIYDTASADAVSGADSNAGRMMAAALMISQGVRVETVGKSNNSGGGSGTKTDFATLPTNDSVTINNADGGFNNQDAHFSIEVNGVMYNADKSQDVTALDAPDLYAQVSIYRSSDGTINFFCVSSSQNDLVVRLSPSDTQKQYSNQFIEGIGAIEADGTFVFILSPLA